MDFETFYNFIIEAILSEKDFFDFILKPIAKILNIKNSLPADKFYCKLQKNVY